MCAYFRTDVCTFVRVRGQGLHERDARPEIQAFFISQVRLPPLVRRGVRARSFVGRSQEGRLRVARCATGGMYGRLGRLSSFIVGLWDGRVGSHGPIARPIAGVFCSQFLVGRISPALFGGEMVVGFFFLAPTYSPRITDLALFPLLRKDYHLHSSRRPIHPSTPLHARDGCSSQPNRPTQHNPAQHSTNSAITPNPALQVDPAPWIFAC